MPKIGVFSLEADLHAHTILYELKGFGVETHFFATDSQIEDGGLVWQTSAANGAVLQDYEGNDVHVSDLSLIWWRRVNQPQKNQGLFQDQASFDLVCNEWRGAIFGAVADSFRGIWVNDPKYDSTAGNKLYQLKMARELGFRVPDTLVTNDADEAIAFSEKHQGNIIAKKILGAGSLSLATVELTTEQLNKSRDTIKLAPVMLQEKIETTKHIRANCFGPNVYSVLIETDDLDWRRNLNCQFSEYDLGKQINCRLSEIVSKLNIKMGIMDLMVVDDGLVWLELNPQGQFLFAEGLSGLNLKQKCAEYFYNLATT